MVIGAACRKFPSRHLPFPSNRNGVLTPFIAAFEEALAQQAQSHVPIVRRMIDEVQRQPDLFPVLRVLADRKPLPAKFLILGSASPDLIKQSSESLAGRMELITLEGLSQSEIVENSGNLVDHLFDPLIFSINSFN